jgi:hypothetical protein
MRSGPTSIRRGRIADAQQQLDRQTSPEVPVLNRAFPPTPQEIEHARALVQQRNIHLM